VRKWRNRATENAPPLGAHKPFSFREGSTPFSLGDEDEGEIVGGNMKGKMPEEPHQTRRRNAIV